MTPLDSFPVLGFPSGGLVKYNKPFLLADDAFQQIRNAYPYRDRILKRQGLELVGRLRRDLEGFSYFELAASPWSFNIKVVSGYVSNADNANPGKITTPYPHNLTTGDFVVISEIIGAIGYNDNAYVATVVDATSFTIGANAALYGAYVSGGFWISNRSLASTEPNAEIVPGTFSVTFNGITIEDVDGNGILTSATPGNYGWIDYVSGDVELTHNTITGWNVVMNYSYYPALPVMGILKRDIPGINDEQTIFFDTRYAYVYTEPNFSEWIPGTAWSSTNSDFFWGANYRGATDDVRLFFETNFIANAANPMRYSTGTAWTTFTPALDAVTNYLFTARMLIPYYGRLIALNTYEGTSVGSAVNYFNRCRFSQIGSPVASDAWRSDQFGKGGFLDAPTNEEIVSAAFIKNTLIVFFEQTTWQLRYVGEYGLPFIWERISSDFGADSTFSPVVFNDYVLAVGDKAIIAASATDVQRIDIAIPDFVFDDIENGNSGPKRVCGIRDYQREIVYWAYPNAAEQRTFPSNVLVYNYRSKSFSIFRDNVTAFGTLQLQNDVIWDSLTTLWDDEEVTWDDSSTQSEFPRVCSGNAEGFVHYYGYTTPDEASLAITAIDRSQTPPVLTIPNHNLETSDIIYLTGLMFLDTGEDPAEVVDTDLNERFFQVRAITADTIAILEWDGSNYISDFSYTPPNGTGTYIGGGRVTLFPLMFVQTKDFNPYLNDSIQTKASYFDFLLDVPDTAPDENVAFTVAIFVNTSPAAVSNMIVGNRQEETTLPIPYYVPASSYAWHRFYSTLNGQFFSLAFTYDNDLMNTLSTHENTWGLNAVTLYCRRGGKNVF